MTRRQSAEKIVRLVLDGPLDMVAQRIVDAVEEIITEREASLKGEAARLARALKPFAKFGQSLHDKPLSQWGGYALHGPGMPEHAEILPTDFERARKAIARSEGI